MDKPLLRIEQLKTTFETHEGTVVAVNNVSFEIYPQERVGIVGESGSGKSQMLLSIIGLLAKNGSAQGNVYFQDRELLRLPRKELDTIRGNQITMIFQDPMTSLNPYLTILQQMTEVLILQKKANFSTAKKKSIESLERLGIPDAAKRINLYPHEFSGGMRQRIMIAMAILCEPKLLIADEPTTALDVTIQAQILEVLKELNQSFGTTIIMVSHDFGVIAELCPKVIIMYAGNIVESGYTQEIFKQAWHPYTKGLLSSMPRLDTPIEEDLAVIPGQPPNLIQIPVGCCCFCERCNCCMPQCRTEEPKLIEIAPDHKKACHLQTYPQ